MSVTSCITRIGKYELGRTLGEGTFAKVRVARNVVTGESVAIKVLDKEKLLKHKMVEQIKREISTMKLVKHPNIVQLHEVLASKTKIYIVIEYVTRGELFDKIVRHKLLSMGFKYYHASFYPRNSSPLFFSLSMSFEASIELKTFFQFFKGLSYKFYRLSTLSQVKKGRLEEDEARKYFQQLINAVDYCHSRGVYHRDLKPENLLLDSDGNLKVSDFGLSALPQQLRADGLLHTTCGTPNYVAPEVINNKGYDGSTADLWSCGVILFVLMAGYLPFDESNLMNLYKKIYRAEFRCPSWFSRGARKLVSKILYPNPKCRITIPRMLENEWFKKGYSPANFFEGDNTNLQDVENVFSDSRENLVLERKESKPVIMNAFALISMSSGLDLSGLFEKQQEPMKQETRFTSTCPAKEIITKIEETAKPLGFNVHKQNYKMKLQGEKTGRKGHLSVATEVFEVAPSFFMVEVRKAAGDTLEYHSFYQSLSVGLKDIVWTSEINMAEAK